MVILFSEMLNFRIEHLMKHLVGQNSSRNVSKDFLSAILFSGIEPFEQLWLSAIK